MFVKRYSILCLPVVLAVMILFNCANQIPPSGGDVDRIPPYVCNSIPKSETLNFNRKGKVTIIFSEWMDSYNISKNVKIFPILKNGFKATLSGKKLEIIPKTEFAESTTYHIELNTSLKDLNNNNLTKPYQISFSTGSTIDSGVISGTVITSNSGLQQPLLVALYKINNSDSLDSVLLGMPYYMVQADSSNSFVFSNIKKNKYKIISFIDYDKNNKLTPGKEPAFSSVEKEIVLNNVIDSVTLYPVESDTGKFLIKSVVAVDKNIIVCQVDNPRDEVINIDSLWKIANIDSLLYAPEIDSSFYIISSDKLVIYLKDSLTVDAYNIIYPRESKEIIDGDTIINNVSKVRFNGISNSDTVSPQIKSNSRIVNGRLLPRLWVSWSEPVKFTGCNIFLIDSLNDSIELILSSNYSDTTFMFPKRKLSPGLKYTVSIPGNYFSDLSGNIFKDSTEFSYVNLSVSTVSAEELCNSLSGKGDCLHLNTSRIWQFVPLRGNRKPYYCKDHNNEFEFDSIPATIGRLGWFLDINKDGLPTDGKLFPWRAPESRIIYSDTVEARARWDVENIKVPCSDY